MLTTAIVGAALDDGAVAESYCSRSTSIFRVDCKTGLRVRRIISAGHDEHKREQLNTQLHWYIRFATRLPERPEIRKAPMAGVPLATLEAWAVPLQAAPTFDHTYVTSSCGLRWRCWGRDNGGKLLNGRSGNSIVADCLSQPNSEAGIDYGITGVCHQTANRILYPAGQITVAGSGGFPLSVFVYGVYGIGGWPQLQTCIPPGGMVNLPPEIGGGGAGTSPTSREFSRFSWGPARLERAPNQTSDYGFYRLAISDLRPAATNEDLVQLDELLALVQSALDHPLDGQKFRALAEIQSKLRGTRAKLSAQLDAGQIEPSAYLRSFNIALLEAMKDCRRVLGVEAFEKIFGKAGLNPEGLIDKDTFLTRRLGGAVR